MALSVLGIRTSTKKNSLTPIHLTPLQRCLLLSLQLWQKQKLSNTNNFLVLENQGVCLLYFGREVILARMCNRNNFLHAWSGCEVKIIPSHIILYQTFHMSIRTKPK